MPAQGRVVEAPGMTNDGLRQLLLRTEVDVAQCGLDYIRPLRTALFDDDCGAADEPPAQSDRRERIERWPACVQQPMGGEFPGDVLLVEERSLYKPSGAPHAFVLLSLPFICVALVLFSLFSLKWLLIGLMPHVLLFNDMKASPTRCCRSTASRRRFWRASPGWWPS